MPLKPECVNTEHGAGIIISLGNKIREFAHRKDGVAAVEFAFVVPIMLSLYFGTMELSQGIEVNKKVGRASSLMADLVTQQPSVTKAEIVAIANIAAATLQPYTRSAAVVDIVGIQVSSENPPKARVVWSQRVAQVVTNGVSAGVGNSFLTVGDIITIPSEYMIKDTFILKGEVKVDYYPFTTYQIKTSSNGRTGIAMGERYYLKSRIGSVVACTNC